MSNVVNLIERAKALRAACEADLARLDEFVTLAEALERGCPLPVRRAAAGVEEIANWRKVHLVGPYRRALEE